MMRPEPESRQFSLALLLAVVTTFAGAAWVLRNGGIWLGGPCCTGLLGGFITAWVAERRHKLRDFLIGFYLFGLVLGMPFWTFLLAFMR